MLIWICSSRDAKVMEKMTQRDCRKEEATARPSRIWTRLLLVENNSFMSPIQLNYLKNINLI